MNCLVKIKNLVFPVLKIRPKMIGSRLLLLVPLFLGICLTASVFAQTDSGSSSCYEGSQEAEDAQEEAEEGENSVEEESTTSDDTKTSE